MMTGTISNGNNTIARRDMQTPLSLLDHSGRVYLAILPLPGLGLRTSVVK